MSGDIIVKRKRGAQPGNHNRLGTGLFARRFTPEELAALHQTPKDLQGQIDMLTLFMHRLAMQLSQSMEFTDKDVAKLKVLVDLCLAIGTLKRSQAYLYGSNTGMNPALQEALRETSYRWRLA
jgi:hypothetical protein